jgi:hypothetical protein
MKEEVLGRFAALRMRQRGSPLDLIARRKRVGAPGGIRTPSKAIHEMYSKLGGQWKEASHTARYPEGLNTEDLDEDLDVVMVYQGGEPFRAPFPKNVW